MLDHFIGNQILYNFCLKLFILKFHPDGINAKNWFFRYAIRSTGSLSHPAPRLHFEIERVMPHQQMYRAHGDRTANRAPSELLFGYMPRYGSDTALKDEVNELQDLTVTLQAAFMKTIETHQEQ